MTPAKNKNFISTTSVMFLDESKRYHDEEIKNLNKILYHNPYMRETQELIAWHKECLRNIKSEKRRRKELNR